MEELELTGILMWNISTKDVVRNRIYRDNKTRCARKSDRKWKLSDSISMSFGSSYLPTYLFANEENRTCSPQGSK